MPMWCSSRVGPWTLLFSLYISPVGRIVGEHNVSHQQFADGTQLYISLSAADCSGCVSQIENRLKSLHTWLFTNGLALYPNQIALFLVLSSERAASLESTSAVNIAGSFVPLSRHLKTFGVTFDCRLSFDQHVSSICKSSYFHIRALRHIRSSLTVDTANAIACSLGHAP